MIAQFNRFEIEMTLETAMKCSHSGKCDLDVKSVIASRQIRRPNSCTPNALANELYEYGSWEKDELKNDSSNWERIVWLAAGNIVENKKEKLVKKT